MQYAGFSGLWLLIIQMIHLNILLPCYIDSYTDLKIQYSNWLTMKYILLLWNLVKSKLEAIFLLQSLKSSFYSFKRMSSIWWYKSRMWFVFFCSVLSVFHLRIVLRWERDSVGQNNGVDLNKMISAYNQIWLLSHLFLNQKVVYCFFFSFFCTYKLFSFTKSNLLWAKPY